MKFYAKYLVNFSCKIILVVSLIFISYTNTFADDNVLGKIRILSMNVWGQNDDSELKCEARLKFIGKKIAEQKSQYNIIGLTEVHPDYAGPTCNGKSLINASSKNGEYTGEKTRWGHPETPWHHYDGGVSLLSTVEFQWSPYNNHVERYNPKCKSRTAHGFIFARLKFSEKVIVDVYVTHLMPAGHRFCKCNRECRKKQLKQLAQGIHKRSANSGYPVLVMGDFNIGGPKPPNNTCHGNEGYSDIMKALRNPRDLWLEAHYNSSGATYPANKNRSAKERIDYIFILSDPYFTNSPYTLSIKSPKLNNVNLVKWVMDGYQRSGWFVVDKWVKGPFSVSDHFGIEATLEFRKDENNSRNPLPSTSCIPPPTPHLEICPESFCCEPPGATETCNICAPIGGQCP